MVYGGRPSRGCQTCKDRKVKCDEARPICLRCAKGKRTCLGFKNDVDLIFRDQTRATVERHQRRLDTGCQLLADIRDTSLPPALQPDQEDFAVNIFFLNFVRIRAQSDSTPGPMTLLPTLYGLAPSNSALASAVAAIALSCFRVGPLRPFLPEARHRYGDTLARLKEDIQDPISARQNDTLMTVLLMGLTELITAESPPPIGTHFDGAIALVKLRGEEMYSTEASRQLLLVVQTEMLPYYIRENNQPLRASRIVSANFKMPLAFPIKTRPVSSHGLSHLNKDILDLRARANILLRQPRQLDRLSLVASLLKRAYELDAALMSWRGNIINALRFATVEWKAPADLKLKLDHADVYSDIWAAKLWNTFRTTRIFIQTIILKSIVWLELGEAARDVKTDSLDRMMAMKSDYFLAKDVLQAMVDEIVRSVPFHLGYITGLKSKFESCQRPGFEHPHAALHNPGTLFIIWPLRVTISVRTLSDMLKAEIGALISDIAKEIGLNRDIVSATNAGESQYPLWNTFSTTT